MKGGMGPWRAHLLVLVGDEFVLQERHQPLLHPPVPQARGQGAGGPGISEGNKCMPAVMGVGCDFFWEMNPLSE